MADVVDQAIAGKKRERVEDRDDDCEGSPTRSIEESIELSGGIPIEHTEKWESHEEESGEVVLTQEQLESSSQV